MKQLNQALFLWINAPEHQNTLTAAAAIFFAECLILAVPVMICIGWLRGNENIRKTMLITMASGLLGLLVNQIIGLTQSHPRPFMISLGHTLIPHAADSSFPSDHLTLWWSVAFSLLLQHGPRSVGLLGIPIAWARIYLGVHFPLDMLGAAVVAALSAWLTLHAEGCYLGAIYRLATHIHHWLFGRLIALGWIRD